MVDEQIRRAEKRVAHIGHHDGVAGDERVEELKKTLHGDFRAFFHSERFGFWRSGNRLRFAATEFYGEQAVHEILEAHILEVVIADRELLAGGVDGARGIEPRGIDTEVDVGHERAEKDHAVARLDVFAHIVAAHRALVNTEVKPVRFADDRLAKDRARKRDAGFFDELQERLLQAEAVNLDIGDDDRLSRIPDHELRLVQRFAERCGVACLMHVGGRVMRDARHVHHVARELDVNGPLVSQRGVQHAVDFLKRGLRIAQDGRGDGELFEDFFLRVKLAHLVVEQRIFFAFLHPRRPADDDDRRFFGECLRRGVCNLQPTDAIRDAHDAQTAQPRVGIRREPRALFVAGCDGFQLAVLQQVVKAEHIIAGDAEDIANAVLVQPVDEVLADGRGCFHSC